MTKKIRVSLNDKGNRSYDIVIGISLEDAARDIRSRFSSSRIFVITDSNVQKFYRKPVMRMLFKEDVPSYTIVVASGEKTKNRKTKEVIEDQLLKFGADRNSLIVALGGGMIGDLAGFVAATLLRGIQYVQMPTSLLAQVDSGVGGKVAVDHPLGKNLIGAFHQPNTVYIDVATLKTLPENDFRNGMAEVIKYGAILDSTLFDLLERKHASILRKDPALLSHIVSRCCELKRNVVQKDERESDYRRILNFGHTIGHALESLSKFSLAHGEAIAIGMVLEAKLSSLIGLKDNDIKRIINLLRVYRLPTEIPPKFSLRKIIEATLADKKMRDGKVHYTLLKKVGRATVGNPITTDDAARLLAQ